MNVPSTYSPGQEGDRRKLSYTAADVFPVKLCFADGVKELRPVHVNWIPTNACNLHCNFCSCSKRDKTLAMPFGESMQIMERFSRLGCKAVTITGGGEPLCYPYISDTISQVASLGIDVGLVTNGLLLDNLSSSVLELLTWCRISHSDSRCITPHYRDTLDRAVQAPVDWAFSYVVSHHPNLREIGAVVDYANEHTFTHVRLVGDLMQPATVPMDIVKQSLAGRDRLVLYQPRKRYAAATQCLLGYVKPVVGPDFNMYLCCGVQYALEGQHHRDLPAALCMGSARDLESIYDSPSPFTVPCARCYYTQYNQVLFAMTNTISHESFI